MADTTPPTSALRSESAIDKAALAIDKLKGCDNWPIWSLNIELALDHTWEYVVGTQTTPPTKANLSMLFGPQPIEVLEGGYGSPWAARSKKQSSATPEAPLQHSTSP